MIHYDGLYGNYITKKFDDVFPDLESFITSYNNQGLQTALSEVEMTNIYYLLLAEYKNSHIANSDENQFIFKVFSTIWQYAPTWAKKIEYQGKIRSLTDPELLEGAKSIYNHSYNPSTAPSTSTLEELETIDDQNTTNYKRSKLDAYFQASQYLEQDFTKEFLDKFRKLFIRIAEPNMPLFYGDVSEV